MSAGMHIVVATSLVVLAFTAAGCFQAVPWSSHSSFRSYARAGHISNVDPEEAFRSGFVSERHYLTLSLDAFFLRNIPGVRSGEAIVGLEVRGAATHPVAIAFGAVTARGHDGFITSARGAPRIGPFLYRGQPIEVTLWVRSTAGASIACSATTCASGVALAPTCVDPGDEAAVALARSQFEALFPTATGPAAPWRYTFSLLPAAQGPVAADALARTLTAQTHILLFEPPALASSRLQAVQPGKLARHLTLRGLRLHWGHSQREFTGLPYLVLSVSRDERNPSPSKGLAAALANLAPACDHALRPATQGDTASQCATALARARVTLEREPLLTARERAFQAAWLALRETQWRTHADERDGNKDRQRDGYQREFERQTEIAGSFPELMRDEDRAYLLTLASATFAAAKRLCDIVGAPSAPFAQHLEAFHAAVKKAKATARDADRRHAMMLMKYETSKVKWTAPRAELRND